MIVFGRIVAALTGALLGIWIGLLATVVRLKKRIMKKTRVGYPEGITDGERDAIDGLIKDANKKFDAATGGALKKVFRVKKKAKGFPIDFLGLIKDVAATINPTSKAPLLELSERQLFDFFKDALAKIRIILDETGVKALKNVDVATFYTSYRFSAGIIKNKAVGTAVKTTDAAIRIINFFNPFFWFKKTLSAAVTVRIARVAAHASIEMVAKEFATLYLDIKETGEDENAEEEIYGRYENEGKI